MSSVPLPKNITKPTSKKEILFCENWLKLRSQVDAAQAAGYSDYVKYGKILKKRFAGYLDYMLEVYAQEASKEIVYDQRDLLNEMAAIGFANPLDYIKVIDDKDADGNPIKRAVQKPLHELTRQQAAACANIEFTSTGATYTIPSPSEKYKYLFSLAKNLGLFSDKLILEHRNANLNIDIDMRNVPVPQLDQLESILKTIMGEEAANKLLGLKQIN